MCFSKLDVAEKKIIKFVLGPWKLSKIKCHKEKT